MEPDLILPDLVRQANCLPYDYADGDGIDYEPFETFLSHAETQRWFRAWNPTHVRSWKRLKCWPTHATNFQASNN